MCLHALSEIAHQAVRLEAKVLPLTHSVAAELRKEVMVFLAEDDKRRNKDQHILNYTIYTIQSNGIIRGLQSDDNPIFLDPRWKSF